MFQGLLVAPTSFRKPHLNMLREATVAQAPRAHFDPYRSEGLFFYPEIELVMEALPCQMFGDQTPSCVSSCCRLWWLQWFFRAAARPGVFQDTSGEKLKISHGNWITPPLETHTQSHTLHTLLPLMPKHWGVTWNLSVCLTDDGSLLSDLTKPAVASNEISGIFFNVWNKADQMNWRDVFLLLYIWHRARRLFSLFSQIPAVLHFMVGREH